MSVKGINSIYNKYGHPLPVWWQDTFFGKKISLVRRLQELKVQQPLIMPYYLADLNTGYGWFDERPANDRRKIVAHLEQCGNFNNPTHVTNLQTVGKPKTLEGYFYQPPNGGKRILQSLYSKLRDYWVRGNGQEVSIDRMNDGHLENTIKLLKESHGNLTGCAAAVIGKIHDHYPNEVIKTYCTTLLSLIEEQEVDDVYPVFATLSAELAARMEGKEQAIPEVDLDEFWTWDD